MGLFNKNTKKSSASTQEGSSRDNKKGRDQAGEGSSETYDSAEN